MDIVNIQRKVKLELAAIRAFVAALPEHVPEIAAYTFTVAFINDERMRQLNHTFRGKNATTDVLSFPMSEPPAVAGGLTSRPESLSGSVDPNLQPPATAGGSDLTTAHRPPITAFLGDIVISADQAVRQADENGLSLEVEIKQLILHGMLHLVGHDHEVDDGEMDARETELRGRLGI